MTRTAWSMALVGVLGGAVLLAAAEAAKPKEDDLSLVKRAVAQNQAAIAPVRPQAEARPAPRAAVRGQGDPQWFKIRVVEKGTRKNKVTVNLPITLVKALGDDVPIDWPCGEGSRVRSTLRMAEVLAALEAGQDLVQVDDEESEVRIWVE
jgi:hypothetical protein